MVLPPFLRDLLNLLRIQLERTNPHVIAEPLLLAARCHRHDSLIDHPPQQDLGRAHRVLLRELFQVRRQWAGGGLCHGHQGRVRRQLDVLGPVVGEQVGGFGGVLEVSVEFDLIDLGPHGACLEDGVEVGREEVRYADRLGFARAQDVFHLRPFLLQVLGLFGEVGRVDQVQVDVVQAKFFEGCVDGAGDVLDVDDDFGGYEQFIARDFGGFDRGAHFGFRVVYFGPVDVVVAHLQGHEDGVSGCFVFRAGGGFVPCCSYAEG